MKYGILGGTFDPPHAGHLALGRAAKEALELDEVVFIPAARNPMKGRKTTPARQRLQMTLLAVEDEPGFSVSDIEVTRGGPSYTVETLLELEMALPGDYWVILGADAAQDFLQWKEPERIAQLARLAVAARDGAEVATITANWHEDVLRRTDVVPLAPIEASSSTIRDRVRRGRPVEAWLKPAVLQYVLEHALYEE